MQCWDETQDLVHAREMVPRMSSISSLPIFILVTEMIVRMAKWGHWQHFSSADSRTNGWWVLPWLFFSDVMQTGFWQQVKSRKPGVVAHTYTVLALGRLGSSRLVWATKEHFFFFLRCSVPSKYLKYRWSICFLKEVLWIELGVRHPPQAHDSEHLVLSHRCCLGRLWKAWDMWCA